MMQPDAWPRGGALLTCVPVLLLMMSGCVGGERLWLASTLEDAYAFEGYHWPPMLHYDAHGVVLQEAPHDEVDMAVPYIVQQMVPMSVVAPGGGFTPWSSTFAPTLGITRDRAVFVSAVDSVQRSLDHGQTWEIAHDFTSPGYPQRVDQMETETGNGAWVDPITNRVFALHYGIDGCGVLAYSDDQGATWRTSTTISWPVSCIDARDVPYVSSQPWIFTSANGPDAVVDLPARPYPTLVYVCEQFGWVGTSTPKCSVSYDGGDTFAYEGFPAPRDSCRPWTFGKPASHPDGTVIIPIGYWVGASGQNPQRGLAPCVVPPSVIVSSDNGVGWLRRDADAKVRNAEARPTVAVGRNGAAYLAFRGDDELVYIMRSRDAFASWEGPWRASPPGLQLAHFSVVTVGDDDRLAVAYLGTWDAQRPRATTATAALDSIWHVFVTTSMDAASESPTFWTQQVTPFEDPIATGPLRPDAVGAFMDSAHDSDGRFYAAFVDACTPRNGCAGDVEGSYASRDRQPAIAVQARGASLFASKGMLDPLNATHPAPVGALHGA